MSRAELSVWLGEELVGTLARSGRRYDRIVTGRAVERIHQEDGCQILGLPPEQKYPRGTGPHEASLARIAAMLVARAQDPMLELRRLLEQTTTNVALLNTDAHAKNISVLRAGLRTVTLSPLYDVAPTAWFLPGQTQAALPVGGKWRITEITRGHLLAEARAWGMPEPVARDVIANTLAATLWRRLPSAWRTPTAATRPRPAPCVTPSKRSCARSVRATGRTHARGCGHHRQPSADPGS